MFKLVLEKAEEPRSNCQHPLDHWKSKRVPEKHLLLLYWLHWSLWLCRSQQTVEILREMGILYHLTGRLRNLYVGQEATVRPGHGTTDWLQIGKGVCQGCILSSCLFNFYAEYIMRNAGLEESQAGIKIAKRISITSDMQMTPPLWQKVKRNWRASWWKWKSRVEKSGVKFNIQNESWHPVPSLHGK